MCGITGIFAHNQVGSFYMVNMAKATEALAHRGPDARGSYVDDFVALGHRRLSIIELSYEANQPMKDASGRYRIVYNGEIFNFRLLKAELEALGHTFSLDSDTELILEAYKAWGSEMLNRFNGFFAMAIYDTETHSMFLARDRYGVKPLYYYSDEDKFIFSSEIKSLQLYNVPLAINEEVIPTFFRLGYIPFESAALKGIAALRPGNYLQLKKKELNHGVWYRPPQIKSGSASHEELVSEAKTLLENAVTSRLIADVPVASFLSGGIDSSIISMLAARKSEDFATFSIGFEKAGWFDESVYAEEVANYIGTRHHTFKLSAEQLGSYAEAFLETLDQPFGDSAALPFYILSKEVSGQIKVVLSGDGADEVWGGYAKHTAEQRIRQGGSFALLKPLLPLLKALPQDRAHPLLEKARKLRKYLSGLGLKPEVRYLEWCRKTSEEDLRLLCTPHCLEHDAYWQSVKEEVALSFKQDASFNAVLAADQRLVLLGDMLPKVDLASMACGLEVRNPFLDYRLVEFATSLGENVKNDGRKGKLLWREAYAKELPDAVFNRPKHGFDVPLYGVLKGPLYRRIQGEWLAPALIKRQNLFQAPFIEALVRKVAQGGGYDQGLVWNLIVFQKWYLKSGF
jgi:asparagine synthase (glutamine-hydrolysing)